MVINITHAIEGTSNLNMDRANLYLIHGAGSEKVATMNIPICPPGLEDCSLPHDNTNSSILIERNISFKEVPLVTVDEIVSKLSDEGQQFPSNVRRRNVMVDMLMIDTEGHDPLVLQGARKLLAQNRIRSIVFEYHRYGR
jgi:hypothetical protein